MTNDERRMRGALWWFGHWSLFSHYDLGISHLALSGVVQAAACPIWVKESLATNWFGGMPDSGFAESRIGVSRLLFVFWSNSAFRK